MPDSSAPRSETPHEIYARVFRELKPRTSLPQFCVEFCPFANVNSQVRIYQGLVHVRMSDMLQKAPAPVIEALAFILLGKLYRSPAPAQYRHRYKLYLNRGEFREQLRKIRQARGRKQLSEPSGQCYDLIQMFEDLNHRYFHGLMARPDIGWSLRPSRSTLGHYDPHHHAIVLSCFMDRPEVPRLAVEYVMFHEMLHLRHPVEHRGARRCVHTPEFKAAEKQFDRLAEAKDLLKRL